MNKSNNQQGDKNPNQGQQQGQQGSDSPKQPAGAPEKTQPQQDQEKAPKQDGDKSSSPS